MKDGSFNLVMLLVTYWNSQIQCQEFQTTLNNLGYGQQHKIQARKLSQYKKLIVSTVAVKPRDALHHVVL